MNEPYLPPLSALRAFEAAARHQSLSGAARELNVTHPAIAQQVRKLEDWFGTRLMERAGRGMALTPAGARLAAGLTAGFGTIAQTVAAVGADAENRPLRITMTPAFAVSWFMPCVGAFRARHPDVELMLNPTSDVVDLIGEDYDVAFRFGRGTWSGLEAERVVATDVAPIASADFARAHPVATIADLARVPWLQELGTDEIRTWFTAHGIDGLETRSVINLPGSIMIDALRRGDGVALLARANVLDDLAQGRLVTLFEEDADPALGYYLVYRPAPHRPALTAFLRWARQDMIADLFDPGAGRQGATSSSNSPAQL